MEEFEVNLENLVKLDGASLYDYVNDVEYVFSVQTYLYKGEEHLLHFTVKVYISGNLHPKEIQIYHEGKILKSEDNTWIKFI